MFVIMIFTNIIIKMYVENKILGKCVSFGQEFTIKILVYGMQHVSQMYQCSKGNLSMHSL